MLQPGVVDEFRKEANNFVAAAEWGRVGELPAAAAVETVGEGKTEQADVGLLTEAGVSAAGAGAAPTSGGVGLGEVFKNVWQQRRNRKKD